MEVILLERVEKLGAIGDVVKVKDGFARNYLLPNTKQTGDTGSFLFQLCDEVAHTTNSG